MISLLLARANKMLKRSKTSRHQQMNSWSIWTELRKGKIRNIEWKDRMVFPICGILLNCILKWGEREVFPWYKYDASLIVSSVRLHSELKRAPKESKSIAKASLIFLKRNSINNNFAQKWSTGCWLRLWWSHWCWFLQWTMQVQFVAIRHKLLASVKMAPWEHLTVVAVNVIVLAAIVKEAVVDDPNVLRNS